MVKTKSAYDPVEESDGERILVARYWPRGLSKERLSLTEHLKDVAPSIELLRDWKAAKAREVRDLHYSQLRARYVVEIREADPAPAAARQ